MKKIFTLFAALAMVMSMSAAPYLKGSFNDWGGGNPLSSGSTTITLGAKATYTFKVEDNGTWYGNDGTMTSTNCTDWTMSSSKGDCKITTTIAGVYTFKWNNSSKKLSVVYPTEAVVINYYIAGDFVTPNWDPGAAANKMDYADGVYSKSYNNVAASAHQFKITNGTWNNAIGYNKNTCSGTNCDVKENGGNIQFTPLTEGTVTITYTLADGKVHITCPEPPVAEFNITYPATQTNYTLVAGPAKAQTSAEVSFTATPAEGYVLNVTYNGNVITGENNVYTFTMPASDVTIAITAVAATTLYYVDHNNWGIVKAYMWDNNGNNGWPGAAMTSVGTVGDKAYSYYSISFAQGAYTNIIFNNGSGSQTDDLTINTAKPYFYDGAWYTWDELLAKLAAPVVTYDYYVVGTINDWGLKDASYGMELSGDVYEKEVAFAIGKHELKINNGQWDNANTFGYDNLSVAYEGVSRGSDDGDNNIVIDLAEAKTITIKLDKNTKKITLEGLTLKRYTVEATVNPVEAGTIEGAGTYNHGAEATLTATPAEGYEFVNWTVGGKEVSTEAAYSFTVTADVALVANFKKSVVTITKSFDLTPENVGNRIGRQTISVEDVDLGSVQLVIDGFSTEVTEYAGASLAIGDDEPLTATATYTNDAKNNKEIYTAIATSADGSTIYNFTFNISLPTSQEFNVMAYENITATKLVAEWGIEYSWEGATEDWNIYIGADNMGNASGSFNDTYVMALEFEVEESMGMLSISGVFTDGTNTYQVYVMGALAPTEEPVVEPTDTITLTSDDLVVTNYPAALGFKGSINEKSGYTIEFTIYDATTYGNYGWDGEWPLIENVALSSDEESIWLDLQKETEVVYYKDETTGQDVVEGQFIDSKTNVLYVVTMKTVKPETPSDLENIAIDGKTVKSIINGQLIIVKDGVQYNAQGAILK